MTDTRTHTLGGYRLFGHGLLLLAGLLWSAAAMGPRPIGGGGSNPCSNAKPEITVSYGCGGVVTLAAW